MGEIFKSFRDDNKLRVAILTAAGEKFFCPGWDLKAASEGDAVDGDYGVGGFGGLQELPNMNKPVIAAVNGICCGGGLEIALSCALIICSDNANLTFSVDIDTYDCTNLGANPVVVTAEDENGNEVTANVVLTVVDDMAPTVVTQDITVSLDANGAATITVADIEPTDVVNNITGSTDNCSAYADLTFSLNQTAFDCTHLANGGVNTVTLSVEDAQGNIGTGTATVTVIDEIVPTVVAQDVAIVLGADGTYTLDPADVDNGSADNCTLILSLDQTAFDCTHLGTNDVILTASDESGNSVSAAAVTVTVTEETNPVAAVQNIQVSLDANGAATITTADVDNGSADGCSAAEDLTLSINVSTFDCTNLGPNNVVLTVTDEQGNSDSATAVVTIVDDMAPTVVAQDISVSLDANGAATITAADIENGSSDNCTADANLTFAINTTDFDCANLGANTVTLSVTDEEGNVGSATVTVTVVDDIAPVAVANDITIEIDANGIAVLDIDDIGASTDNCAIYEEWVNKTTFDCGDIGVNTVNFVAEDTSGNQDITTFTVTVEDNTTPVGVAQDITVSLDANGSVTITPDMIDNGSSDNCTADADLTLTLDVDTFDCTNLGENTVVLGVADASGNAYTSSITVAGTTASTYDVSGFDTGIPSDSWVAQSFTCLLYTSPSPRDLSTSRMPSSA